MENQERIILGIDPGTTVMGYGLIEIKGKKLNMLALGCLQLSKYSDQPLKLKKIFERTLSLIEEYHPDELAIEAPFYGKNVQSVLKLGRAQGVAIAAALFRSIPVFEYQPRKVKKAITGNGAASKEQVASMLTRIVGCEIPMDSMDATDGLAVALCHYLQKSPADTTKSYTGWRSFIADNPGRVSKK